MEDSAQIYITVYEWLKKKVMVKSFILWLTFIIDCPLEGV